MKSIPLPPPPPPPPPPDPVPDYIKENKPIKPGRKTAGFDFENMETKKIAQVAYEINRAYCQAIGDDSQPKWEDATEWQKKSAINGVLFHIKNTCASPSRSHDSWLAEKEEAGWVYGAVKNPQKKQHPCMVPFDKLPTEQKAKDYIFRQVVHSLLRIK